MLCGEAGTLLRAAFDPMEIRKRVSWPEEWAIVVGVSGVLAEKTGAALQDYNRGPKTLRDFLARWNAHTGRSEMSIASAVDALAGTTPCEDLLESLELAELLEAVPELVNFLALAQPGYERRRVEQFLEESLLLVPAGARAVSTGDAARVAEIVRRSHAAAEAKLLNQVPATTAMVRQAQALGAIAASGFGAGWGGSVYAVVRAAEAQDFAEQWLAEYRRHGLGNYLSEAEAARASTIVTRPGPGARSAS